MKVAKKILPVFALIVTLLSGTQIVSARTFSSIYRSSDTYSGKRTSTSTITMTTNEYSSVNGSIMHIKPRAIGTLEMGSTSGSRTIEFTIYEDDQYPNADDKVRGYVFNISGRKMVKGVVGDTQYEFGNIDSAGDNTVELYLETYLPAKSGDTSANNGNMINFQYYIGDKLNYDDFWANCVIP